MAAAKKTTAKKRSGKTAFPGAKPFTPGGGRTAASKLEALVQRTVQRALKEKSKTKASPGKRSTTAKKTTAKKAPARKTAARRK